MDDHGRHVSRLEELRTLIDEEDPERWSLLDKARVRFAGILLGRRLWRKFLYQIRLGKERGAVPSAIDGVWHVRTCTVALDSAEADEAQLWTALASVKADEAQLWAELDKQNERLKKALGGVQGR